MHRPRKIRFDQKLADTNIKLIMRGRQKDTQSLLQRRFFPPSKSENSMGWWAHDWRIVHDFDRVREART